MSLVEQFGVYVGSMNCGMTSGRPACSLVDSGGVGGADDDELTGRTHHLSVAAEAKVVVSLGEELGVDGSNVDNKLFY